MKLPSRIYCEELFEKYAVPAPIRRHCEAVARVGVFLGERLLQAKVCVDNDLIEIGCRLHDAFKAASLKELIPCPEWGYSPSRRELEIWSELRSRFNNTHETMIAAQILNEEFPDFSKFVSLIGSTGNPSYLSGGMELKIVHYADWRVQFDKIISFDERLNYLCETYKDSWIKSGIPWDKRYIEEKSLENEIFTHLSFAPDDLAAEMER